MPQHLLIIASVWPEPNSSAAGSRMMQLISLFQSEGWQITFASAAAGSEYRADLESLGIVKVTVEINSLSFDEFIQDLQPSMVMFDRFMVEEQFGWRVAEQCPDCVKILDTEDLHCLRKGRRQAAKAGRSFEQADLLSSDTAKREIASILRCDLSLIISEFEMDLLQGLFQIDSDLLHYVPFMLDLINERTVHKWPSFEECNHFVTIGNFRHPPNWDAVLYLKQEIWSLIREKLPDAELHIYGAYPSSKVKVLHKAEEGFHIKGRAKDAKAVVRRAKVCLAPLRFGAGLKGKLVEAMQCGAPSVTTDIGAEGLNGGLDWSGIIANEPAAIASAAVDLFTNKSVWQKTQQNGAQIINKRFRKELFAEELVGRIAEIQQNLDEHRLKNFTGSMLMHHSMAGTKYMSKWIEEKGKR